MMAEDSSTAVSAVSHVTLSDNHLSLLRLAAWKFGIPRELVLDALPLVIFLGVVARQSIVNSLADQLQRLITLLQGVVSEFDKEGLYDPCCLPVLRGKVIDTFEIFRVESERTVLRFCSEFKALEPVVAELIGDAEACMNFIENELDIHRLYACFPDHDRDEMYETVREYVIERIKESRGFVQKTIAHVSERQNEVEAVKADTSLEFQKSLQAFGQFVQTR